MTLHLLVRLCAVFYTLLFLRFAVHTWVYRFTAECVAEVVSKTLTTETPSYSVIVELDRKVREFPAPDIFSQPEEKTFSASLKRCIMEHVRETGVFFSSHFIESGVMLAFDM